MQYAKGGQTSSIKKKISLVLKVSKAKNKIAECLKLEIAISAYYYQVR